MRVLPVKDAEDSETLPSIKNEIRNDSPTLKFIILLLVFVLN
jgi:hypothetical protein